MLDYLLVGKTPRVLFDFRPQLRISSSPPCYHLFHDTIYQSPSLISSNVSIRSYGGPPKHLSTAAAAMNELEAPSSVDLVQIIGEDQFDLVLTEAQRLKEPLIVLWTANWCRKCIYLKPKLEKLAAEYYPRVRFYCIDVNLVPQSLVNRAGVTKMPTIQLWDDFKIRGEVYGGYAAWMVIEDIKRMIEIDNEEP